MVIMTTKITGYISLWSGMYYDISLWLVILYYDISITTGLYVKYIPVDSLDLRC